MTSTIRKFLLTSSVFLGLSALGGCSGTEQSTEDILAQDSSLAREVMSANRDTAAMISPADTPAQSVDPVESTPVPVASTATVFEADEGEPARSREPIAQPAARATISKATARPRRAARSSAPARSGRVSNSARRSASRATVARDAGISGVSRTPSGVLASSTSSRSAKPGTKLRGSAIIPAGSTLSFASDERICTSTGDVVGRFSTRLAEDVVGPIGVVIPKGSIATGLVAARGNAPSDNPERAIHIQSLTFGGRTYSLSSEVTAAELDKKRTRAGAVVANRTTGFDRCVPTGGLITARLTEPLRVALGE